ncbi:MAG: outer membrane lipoprotein-sorting protein [Deltaproteobacteria bacterium]|nr:outer membrane lipoprotein-sorting protein [Deltaproteobacteria bacterium]
MPQRSKISKCSVSFIAAVIIAAFAANASGAEMSAEEIVEKALATNNLGFEKGSARVVVEMFNPKGEKTERVIKSLAKDDGSGKKIKITFLEPADVRDTTLLILEKSGEKESRHFLYLPAYKKVRAIAGSEKYSSFMGSDFFYADLESKDIKKGKYEKIGFEKTGGRNCHKILVIPEDREFYSKLELYIDAENFLPLKALFYDKENKHVKTFAVKKVQKSGGSLIVVKSVMQNVQKKSETVITIENFDLGAKVEDIEFNPELLGK